MIIEISDETAYEAAIQHVQFEITGNCNMRCAHCRAWKEPKVELPLSTIKEVMSFGSRSAAEPFFVTISGGEPFSHSGIAEVVHIVSEFPVTEVIITTNGWHNDRSLLQSVRSARVGALTVQVSLDSVNRAEHDVFRRTEGAFDRAINTIRLAQEVGLGTSIRMSVGPQSIGQMSDMVNLAASLGVTRVGLGPIVPVGRAQGSTYRMTANDKRWFHEELARLRVSYRGVIEVTTEDPLKFVLGRPDVWDDGGLDPNEDGVFGGCTAGISSFNVGSSGLITPCAVLPIQVASVNGMSALEIEAAYSGSKVIKALFRRTFSGACGQCARRRTCGGCRAIPYSTAGDYLGQDPTCWACG